MIIKSSMAPYGDRASALEAYTGAGGTGRESERGHRAWSLAGTNPESSQHMDVSPASREKRRGVYPVSPRPEHRGAGGKSVSEDRVCPSDPIPGVGKCFSPRKSPKHLGNPSLAWEIHTHPPTILASRATHHVSQRSVSQSASAAGLLLRRSSHYPQHPTPRHS